MGKISVQFLQVLIFFHNKLEVLISHNIVRPDPHKVKRLLEQLSGKFRYTDGTVDPRGLLGQ